MILFAPMGATESAMQLAERNSQKRKQIGHAPGWQCGSKGRGKLFEHVMEQKCYVMALEDALT